MNEFRQDVLAVGEGERSAGDPSLTGQMKNIA